MVIIEEEEKTREQLSETSCRNLIMRIFVEKNVKKQTRGIESRRHEELEEVRTKWKGKL